MNKINVYQRYYIDQHPERNQELEFCYTKNISNPHIHFVLVNSSERMKYSDFIVLINKSTGSEDINVIANSDIYFNDTVQLIHQIKKNQAYVLSRWDQKPNGDIVHFDRSDSQDVWAFRGPIRTNFEAGFLLGYRGCDNRLAYELQRAGYEVLNPSKSIQTIHVHNSNVRYYTLNNSLIPGPYLTVHTTSL